MFVFVWILDTLRVQICTQNQGCIPGANHATHQTAHWPQVVADVRLQNQIIGSRRSAKSVLPRPAPHFATSRLDLGATAP